jgi:hypothetical protein
MDRGQPSVSYSEQRLGCGCGVSAASITRRLLARSPSSSGGRTLPAINYGLALAAPVAAAKERLSSIQAGPAIILAFSRFQLLSSTGDLIRADVRAYTLDAAQALADREGINDG